MTAAIVRRVAAVALIAVATARGPSWRDDNSAPMDIEADGAGTVTLDGVVIIDRSFHVGDQHNFVEHRIQLSEGTHRLNASTVIDGENIELSEAFCVEAGQQRYAGLNYRHYVPTSPNDPSSDPPWFSFVIQDEPIGFA